MPLVRIEIRAPQTPEYKKAILDGVHAALVQTIQIPDHDRWQRIYELAPENSEVPLNKTEQATLIEITMFEGRSPQAKKALYQAIVENLARDPGISGDDILIVLYEPPLHNWGIRGGQPASEVDLGFQIMV